MRLCQVQLVKRMDGQFFLRDGRIIQAYRVGNGIGVMVLFGPSQIDDDFQDLVWCPSQDELERIQWYLDESDHRISELLGRKSWGGRRPFRLEEFM